MNVVSVGVRIRQAEEKKDLVLKPKQEKHQPCCHCLSMKSGYMLNPYHRGAGSWISCTAQRFGTLSGKLSHEKSAAFKPCLQRWTNIRRVNCFIMKHSKQQYKTGVLYKSTNMTKRGRIKELHDNKITEMTHYIVKLHNPLANRACFSTDMLACCIYQNNFQSSTNSTYRLTRNIGYVCTFIEQNYI